MSNNHQIDSKNSKIIDKCNYRHRTILESWHTAMNFGKIDICIFFAALNSWQLFQHLELIKISFLYVCMVNIKLKYYFVETPRKFASVGSEVKVKLL